VGRVGDGGQREETNNRSVPLSTSPELIVFLASHGIKERSRHVTGRHGLNQPGILLANRH
jgi:hypothetical protein